MSYLRTLTDGDTYQNLRRTSLTVGGTVCTLGGFVADVLQPIAPFANYLLYISFAALAAVLALYLKGNKNVLGLMVLTAIASVVFGLLSTLQLSEESQESGVIASAIPAVESLQQSLGIIDRKLDYIKADTESIKATTSRLEENSEAVMASLDAIREGIGKGGIIANPNSPEEYYHNARVHEIGGDYSAARRSYLAYFRADLPLLDPHLRFISFLKVQEGTAGARETYNTVTENSSSPMPAYARLLLLDPGKRAPALKLYLKDHSQFAPAAYHLSLEYSERRLGSQTLYDKRQELVYITAFQRIDEQGGLLRYMIDQDLVRQWREDAQARKLALDSGAAGLLKNPVAISWMSHNGGWNGNIQISESATDIQWNIKGQSSPTSTGSSGRVDPNTGKASPRSFFTLPSNQRAATVEIRYTDLTGMVQGPYEFAFKPGKESNDGNRRILETTSGSWVALREMNGSVLLYFTHLMTYRGALSKISYGVNRAEPNKKFKFPRWNKPGLAPIDAKTPLYITVPRSTKYVSVQLTFKNGDTSPVQRFER